MSPLERWVWMLALATPTTGCGCWKTTGDPIVVGNDTDGDADADADTDADGDADHSCTPQTAAGDCVAPADPCSIAVCVDGECAQAPIDCDDGLDCTNDSCSAGECVHSIDRAICTEGPNTYCDPVAGCIPPPRCEENQAVCDDGIDCTIDACAPADPGADVVTGCVHDRSDAFCDTDGAPCTIEVCDPANAGDDVTGCVVTVDHGMCDDHTCLNRCAPAELGADATGCLVEDPCEGSLNCILGQVLDFHTRVPVPLDAELSVEIVDPTLGPAGEAVMTVDVDRPNGCFLAYDVPLTAVETRWCRVDDGLEAADDAHAPVNNTCIAPEPFGGIWSTVHPIIAVRQDDLATLDGVLGLDEEEGILASGSLLGDIVDSGYNPIEGSTLTNWGERENGVHYFNDTRDDFLAGATSTGPSGSFLVVTSVDVGVFEHMLLSATDEDGSMYVTTDARIRLGNIVFVWIPMN